MRIAIQRLVHAAVGVLCLTTAYYCYRFVLTDYIGARMAFEGAPFWVLESIMPIAFLVIGLRYLARALTLGPESSQAR